jgi:double-stranded uracil-DNA glycosylase
VAFNGLAAARKVLARDPVLYGPQPEKLGTSAVHALPSTSGVANKYWDMSYWEALAKEVAEL